MAQTTEFSSTAHASRSADLENWWKNAVIYEVYPRSFQDSNGDGIGDLNGITSRLDYLERLGVDAIWITPCYPSPQVDLGYDISDYVSIDPQYGTMADFERLVATAEKHHIRIVMDMVMNHSSDQHPWFLESRSSRNNLKRDWYVWKDGKGETATINGGPPNNWQSGFGHSAWGWDEKTRQYYYHRFYSQQPDLNWNNPLVKKAFDDILNFWMKKGVAGFRFDAITMLFEDPTWRDEKELKDKDGKAARNGYGDTVLDDAMTNNRPEVHKVVQHVRQVEDAFKSNIFPGRRIMIGETYVPTIQDLLKLYGTNDKPEFQLPMDTQVGFIDKLDVAAFRTRLNDAETKIEGNEPLLVFDNHDDPRIDARYGDGIHDTDITRVISTILFASRGTALLYYGAEIGMKTTPPEIRDEKDAAVRNAFPKGEIRDGERTPMQWDASAYAGFSTTKPWLPVPSNKDAINVKAEEADPNSLLNWYTALIRLKKSNPALARGENVMLDTSNMEVLSWLRRGKGKSVLVAANFTAQSHTVNLGAGMAGSKMKTLLKTPGLEEPISIDKIDLPAFGVYIGEIQ